MEQTSARVSNDISYANLLTNYQEWERTTIERAKRVGSDTYLRDFYASRSPFDPNSALIVAEIPTSALNETQTYDSSSHGIGIDRSILLSSVNSLSSVRILLLNADGHPIHLLNGNEPITGQFRIDTKAQIKRTLP